MTSEVNLLELAHLTAAGQRVRRFHWMIKELEHTIKLVPSETERCYGQAVAQFLLGRFAEAQSSLESALQADADHLPSLNLLSETLLKLGKYRSAVAIFERLLKLEPDNMIAITGLCLTYHCLGKAGHELAKESILQVIAPDLLASSLRA